jgi:hypothetical protein
VSDAQLLCAAAHPATYLNHSYRLSAHLANLTSNHTYLDAAVLSANFSFKQMLDTNTSLLAQELDLGGQTTTCVIDSNATLPKQPYQTGSFIEALSVLADLTDDIKWTSLYVGVTQGVAVVRLLTKVQDVGASEFFDGCGLALDHWRCDAGRSE